jgi:FkbM family methyltransferase
VRGLAGVVIVLLCSAPALGAEPEKDVATAVPGAQRGARKVDVNDIIGTQKKRFSQQDEELIIRDFFKDRRDGFYVDAGCAFARSYSTTFYLESRLGWSGIGIDAVPSYADGWKKHRPRGKFVNYLVTDRSGEEDTFYVADYHPISSIHEKIAGPKHTKVKVPTITLNDLLEQNGVEKVDLVSMDIEGAQLAALRAFDIEKYRPELLCVEVWLPDQKEIVAYFEQHGYKRIVDYARYDWVNWYFAPKDHPRLAEIAARESARPQQTPSPTTAPLASPAASVAAEQTP